VRLDPHHSTLGFNSCTTVLANGWCGAFLKVMAISDAAGGEALAGAEVEGVSAHASCQCRSERDIGLAELVAVTSSSWRCP